MNRLIFLLFFTIFFSVLFLVNRYVYVRGVTVLSETSYLKTYKWMYWVLPIIFIVGQILERGNPHFLSKVITSIGSVWLAWFLYVLIAIILIDIIRLFNHFIHFIPQGFINGKVLFFSVLAITWGIVFYGIYKAAHPVVKHITIPIDKPLTQPLRIAVVSDLHIGAVRPKSHFEIMAAKINAENPDIVLIAGDLVDHNPRFGIKEKVGEVFDQMHPPLGIYAVTGNHEYLGHAEVSIEYLSKHGVHYLRDKWENLANRLVLIGREDREKSRLTGAKRKSLEEILQEVPRDLPLILMDHQPVEYENVVQQSVDLMLSGHTHKGQMWPMNYITSAVFENDYGLYQKGKTWFYTSNGYGTWGPPVRVGNTPEIVIIELKN